MKSVWKAARFSILLLCSVLIVNTVAATGRAGTIIEEDITSLLPHDARDNAYRAIWPADLPCDVVDEDLVINGTVVLPAGTTRIRACTTDVVVTLDGTLQANAAGSTLQFEANAGLTITVVVANDNGFQGASNGTDLVVLFRGMGETRFELGDGVELSFDKNGANGGSVQSFVIMECASGSDEDQRPRLTFGRSATVVNAQATVVIGEGSIMSFASSVELQAACTEGLVSGSINFDPSNDGQGRLVLDIKDQGAFVVAGHLITQIALPPTDACPTDTCDWQEVEFGPVNLAQPVFGDARVAVLQEDAVCDVDAAPFFIVNENETLGELLIDPWGNLGTRQAPGYIGIYNGVQYGFIVGANGTFDISDNANVQYVALGCMVCPTQFFCQALCGLTSQIKQRNPAALTIDGSHDPIAVAARINVGSNAGLFFRAGANSCCEVEYPLGDCFEFVVNSVNQTAGAGVAVLSVEGPVAVYGQNVQSPTDPNVSESASKLEILSIHVRPAGAGLFDCCVDGCFPWPTWCCNPCTSSVLSCATDCATNELAQYNKGFFFVNNDLALNEVTLAHTDATHKVYMNDDVRSEPTYVGGETFRLLDEQRPRISGYNFTLNVHTDIAFTGLDVVIPNLVDPVTEECADNISRAVFFANPIQCDRGFGRAMVLGTRIGSVACDGFSVISQDAHMDVAQTTPCTQPVDACRAVCETETCPAGLAVHQLRLQVGANSECTINPFLVCSNQSCYNAIGCPPVTPGACSFSSHSIYLGHNSNISIGSYCPPVPASDCGDICFTGSYCCSDRSMLKKKTRSTCFSDIDFDDLALVCCQGTHPTLSIDGNFFTFGARGGDNACDPTQSAVTGKGGIFVDNDGTLIVDPFFRAAFNVMVVRSGTGRVILPKAQVVWGPGFGVADWRLDLTEGQVCNIGGCPSCFVPIVCKGETFAEYTLDWATTIKDYDAYIPYAFGCYSPTCCPPVVCENMNALPTIEGVVDQLIIKGSRLGDPASVMVNGGWVKEFVYAPGCLTAEAATSVIVIQENGRIGLGSAHRNAESEFASVTLGVNGVSVIANGSGIIELNEDVIVDNTCQFLKGPEFNDFGNELTITSNCCRTIRVKSTGSLDFSSFTEGQVIFAGNVTVVFEPGAKLFLAANTCSPTEFCGTDDGAGSTSMRLRDHARFVLESVVQLPDGPISQDCANHPEFSPTDLDEQRVKFIGRGTISFVGCSSLELGKNTFLGVETLNPASAFNIDGGEVRDTKIEIAVGEAAHIAIGGSCLESGGALQVGNTQPHDCGSVRFALTVSGDQAEFAIGSGGFLGLGVGIANKKYAAPNLWLVDTLYDVSTIDFNVPNGKFVHDRIYSGDEAYASLFAISNDDAITYTLNIEPITIDPFDPDADPETITISRSALLGGGNMVLVTPNSTPGSIYPIVQCTDGQISDRLSASLFTSTTLLPRTVLPPIATGAQLFNYLRVPPVPTTYPDNKTAYGPAARSDLHNTIRFGYIDNCSIARINVVALFGTGSMTGKQNSAVEVGAAGATLFGTQPTVCPTTAPGQCNISFCGILGTPGSARNPSKVYPYGYPYGATG